MKKLNRGVVFTLSVVLLGMINSAGDCFAGKIRVVGDANGYDIKASSANGKVLIGRKSGQWYRIYTDGSSAVTEILAGGANIKSISAVSDDGATVFGKIKDNGENRYVYWKESAGQINNALDSGLSANVNGCTDAGYYFSNLNNRLSVYKKGAKVASLQVSSISGSSGNLSAISKNGKVVIGRQTVSGLKSAVFWNNWQSNNKATTVASYLSTKGVVVDSQSSLTNSQAVSGNGNHIAGLAFGNVKKLFVASMNFDGANAELNYIDKFKTWDSQSNKLGSDLVVNSLTSPENLNIVGVSNQGNIAVGNWEDPYAPANGYTFIWFKDRKITLNDGTEQIGFAMKLDEYLEMENIVLDSGKSFEIQKVLGMSEDGHSIICQGSLDGVSATFEVNLPEPASMTIFLTASLALLRKRRKKNAC